MSFIRKICFFDQNLQCLKVLDTRLEILICQFFFRAIHRLLKISWAIIEKNKSLKLRKNNFLGIIIKIRLKWSKKGCLKRPPRVTKIFVWVAGISKSKGSVWKIIFELLLPTEKKLVWPNQAFLSSGWITRVIDVGIIDSLSWYFPKKFSPPGRRGPCPGCFAYFIW